MPKFLEDKLRAEYGNNPHAIYGTMNKIGAMHGNKETQKGKQMEKKHEHKMSHMIIRMHEDGGHTVEHHMHPKSSGKSMAFMEHSEPKTHVFGKGEKHKMAAHLAEHLDLPSLSGAGHEESDGSSDGGGELE